MRNKQANIGKLLASLGLGGLIGGGIGRVSGYSAGNREGYSQGSANASKDTLINLLKGMTGVVQQGAESKLDLKKLLESKPSIMPSLPITPINEASLKTASLCRVLYRFQKTATEKRAIAALLSPLFRAVSRAPLTTAAVGLGGMAGYEFAKQPKKLANPALLPNASTPPPQNNDTGLGKTSLDRQILAALLRY